MNDVDQAFEDYLKTWMSTFTPAQKNLMYLVWIAACNWTVSNKQDFENKA